VESSNFSEITLRIYLVWFQKIKKKIVYYIVIYGLFSAALFFILLGLVKFLSDLNFFPSEGIGLMITGSIMIVALAAYSLIKKI